LLDAGGPDVENSRWKEKVMLEATTVSMPIGRPWRAVYAAIWRPEAFPTWATGLSGATMQPDGDRWKAQGPEGPVSIRFTGHNAFGVMDHGVDTGHGPEILVPMRVVANGEDGAEILLTLFRQPGMTEAAYARDIEWVRRDLAGLRDLLMRGGG
jgi:hypothetical protein